MDNIVDKGTGDDLTAVEYTSHKNAPLNAIIDSGITPSGSDAYQLSKGISNYVGSGNFYTDSVTANAVVLTAQSPMKAPTALKNGLLVRFDAGGTNTAAVTINVAGLGAKDLVSSDGSVLYAGQITAGNYIEAKYNSSDTKFYIVANKGEDVKADGSVPFVEPQSGVTPTASANLTTKGYVDTAFVKKDGSTPFTAVQTGITPTSALHLATKGYTDTALALKWDDINCPGVLATNGRQVFNNGFTIKWGTYVSNTDTDISVSFASPFSTACIAVIDGGNDANDNTDNSWSANTITVSGFKANRDDSASGTFNCNYIAFGY